MARANAFFAANTWWSSSPTAAAVDVAMGNGETVSRSVSFGRSMFPLIEALVT